MKRNQQLREEVEKNRKHTPCWSCLLDYFYKRQIKNIKATKNTLNLAQFLAPQCTRFERTLVLCESILAKWG